MKYVAPEMEIIALSADTAVANDYGEPDVDFSEMVSSGSMPNA